MEADGAQRPMMDKPDIMNDPAFDRPSANKEKGAEDFDTCRICRGEGSKEEPLFYPCKCSGSIKFVHQNCLMEWLSHSQKKHCELCKTPFHFTKLYSPHMPESVPFLVFMRQAVLHAYRNILSWSRLQLVLFVWAACLPYGMRLIWRGLFWLGDGGWLAGQEMERRATATARQYMDNLAATGTTPADFNRFTSRDAGASAVVSHVAQVVPSMLAPMSSVADYVSGGPLLFRLGRKLVRGMVTKALNESGQSPPDMPLANLTTDSGFVSRPSLLSDIAVLQNLTRFPRLNEMLVDMFEGQIITLSIVVAFILIFLIREWVVQQQPAIAIAAVADAAALEAQVQNNPQVDVGRDAQQENQVEPDTAQREPAAVNPDGDGNRLLLRDPGRVRTFDEAQRTRQVDVPESNDHDSSHLLENMPVNVSEPSAENEQTGESKVEGKTGEPASILDDGTTQIESRPSMPAREASSQASEIRRILDEKSGRDGRPDPEWLKTYMDLWARGEKKPAEVIQIIHREGRTEELGWIVKAMERLAKLENDFSSRRASIASTDADQIYKDVEEIPTETEPTKNLATSKSLSPEQIFERLDAEDAPTTSHVRLNTPREHTNENRPLTPQELPHIEQDPKDQSEFIPLGLRDISNQQFDGANDLPPQQRAGSEHSFVMLSNGSPPKSPTTEHLEGNPFHPEYEGAMPASSMEMPRDLDVTENDVSPGHGMPVSVNTPADVGAPGANEQVSIIPPVNQSTNDDPNPPRGFFNRVLDWLWGEPSTAYNRLEAQEADEERIVEQVEEEAPFVPMVEGRPVFEPEEAQEPGPAPAAQDADIADVGLEPNAVEVVEDAEDLEGIMELVGMQGPLFGLIQNAIFCSVIVAVTIGLGIWIPYISGKLFLVFLTNPVTLLIKMPLRWISTTADILVDLCVFSVGCSFYWIDTAVSFLCRPVTRHVPLLAIITERSSIAEAARDYAESALDRLARNLIATSGSFLESDIPTFSIVAHESLFAIENSMSGSIKGFFEAVVKYVSLSSTYELTGRISSLVHFLTENTAGIADYSVHKVHSLNLVIPQVSLDNLLQVNLTIPQRTSPLDLTLAQWDSRDRTLAIVLGYIFFGLIGSVYLKISAAIRGTNASGRVGGSIADGLYQAGGVMKVILIISIEMILFPLFCGLLLDIALLPLFGDVTVLSRLNFGLAAPYTSLFIHWFIGTCYMFHFALFVSMCRKIMRSGVLYFIRDPDDPTFHPVRDVLERNLFTQLRKIVFSAVVYGALVMICLGGVVWGISYAFGGVFPVYWSPNEPVLEFPVDLLFYNFLMPVAVRFFKPSSVLNQTYNWWFRKCARVLRLSHFLFGDKREDEEGHHVRHTWRAVFYGELGDPSKPVTNIDQPREAKNGETEAYFLRDGRYVRAPASDQVRMPRGTRTFLEVDEYNRRVDKLVDQEQGPHGWKNDQFTKVYVPPSFRLRISIFIFLIWLFAATTGLCTTVVPLVIGRYIFAQITPSHLRMNDIYAFSIGIYTLGGTGYALLFACKRFAHIRSYLTASSTDSRSLFRRVQSRVYRALRILYIYTAFIVFLPALFALLIQTYAIIPLHTYLGTVSDRHTIHIVQDWALGVLYIQAIGRLILHYSPSRPAEALRGIVRDGWLDPDTRLATRAFIFPSTVLMVLFLTLPMALGWAANAVYFQSQEEAVTAIVYRYSAPALLGAALMLVGLAVLKRAFQSWRGRIRDEVYLIGERLHNFGERRKVGRAAAGGRVTVRA